MEEELNIIYGNRNELLGLALYAATRSFYIIVIQLKVHSTYYGMLHTIT